MLTNVLISVILSDQFDNWSDRYAERILCRASEAAQRACPSAAAAAINPARFPHRAIQAVRQAGMQMRQRSRTWPQILSVGKLPREATADGLRAAGERRTGSRVSGQLSSGARDPGRDLRDQPRAAAPPRVALTRCHERIADSRSEAGWRACCQYACRLVGRAARACALCGGRR